MTDHPHAKLLEEARETSRNLRSEQHPEPIDPKAIYRTRSTAIFNASANTIDRLAAALETAPPAPPSASLVKARFSADERKAAIREEILAHVELADGDEEYLPALLDMIDGAYEHRFMRALTAHPAADAPPSDEENDR